MNDRAPDGIRQHARSSGNGRTYQAGQNIYVTEGSPAPQALAALPPAPHLTGRDGPTAALLKALGPEGPPVTVVTGLPGVGKTALALHAAHRAVALGHFPGGTLFLHLRGYDPAGAVAPEQALEALLRALGVRDDDLPPTPEEQAALYRSELARRADRHGPVLIVADDASTTTQLAPLTPAHPAHRLLATSRHALTDPDFRPRLLPLDELDTASAARLIAEALTQPRPEDPRPAAEPEALARVVAHCGRLPLALTIAAALLADDPGLPVAALAEDLADARTRLETLRHENGTGRSLAVRAAFDLSYHRLRPPDARLFRLLPLNPGPDLSTEAAAALAGRPPRETRTSLAALARAGLIAEHPLGSARWRMHDLIRLYAAELPPEREDAEALERLLEHYSTTCEAADDHLRALPGQPVSALFADRTAALTWLDAERSNLIAAVPRLATGAPRAVLFLTSALNVYVHQRRRFHDALAIGASAVTAARELGDRQGEARALNNLGLALRKVRRFDEAIAHHTQAADVYREFGNRQGEARALNNLGLALQAVRRHDEAIAAHDEDLAICRDLGDRRGEARALNNLGLALQAVRRHDEAIAAHDEDLAICRDLGDRQGEAQALNNLGLALQAVHRHAEAITAHTRAAAFHREHDDRYSEAQALSNLGLALRAAHRHDEALAIHREVLATYRALGDRDGEAPALNNLGLTLRGLGRFDEAIAAHTEAVAAYRELGDRHSEAQALGNLGLALQAVRRHDEAVAAHTRAIAVFQEMDDQHSAHLTRENLARAVRGARATAGKRRRWPFGRGRAGRAEA
ncbi:tetratricopeptide repeat protein [Streptomyces sp. NPDC035033]|uniref:tetratricopeptide repeat protein n=1 Tax=Streptomyces sp. NPDC035033 TaxID=3155368 RepID=UPI00340E44CF